MLIPMNFIMVTCLLRHSQAFGAIVHTSRVVAVVVAFFCHDTHKRQEFFRVLAGFRVVVRLERMDVGGLVVRQAPPKNASTEAAYSPVRK